MANDDVKSIGTFAQARERLEEIVSQVKDKDMPLEKSLDLYEEAIALANRCSDLIDDGNFSAEEIEAAEGEGTAPVTIAALAEAPAGEGDGAGGSGEAGAR